MGYRVVRFGTVGSTNDIALDAADAGAAPGLVVAARVQARGKGRRARDWTSPEGGLWATVLLDPAIALAVAGLVPLAVGVACAEALQAHGVGARVRWPNDLMLGDRKLGGILVESRTEGDRLRALAAGIGINVRNEPPVRDGAACSEAAPALTVNALLASVLERLATAEGWLEAGDAKRVCERFIANAWGLDRPMLLDGEPVTPREIAIDGALIVERPGDRIDVVRSGSLRPA